MLRALRSHLQIKLTLAFIAVMLLPTLVITLFSINSATDAILQSKREIEIREIRHVGSDMEQRLESTQNDLRFLYTSPIMQSYANALADGDADRVSGSVERLLSDFLQYEANIYSDVHILDADGHEILTVSDSGTPSTTPQNPPPAYFDAATALPPGDVYISDVDLRGLNGEMEQLYVPVLHFAMPLDSENGQRVGVLALDARMSAIFAEIPQDAGATYYVVDANNDSYLYHPDATKLYGRLLGTESTFSADQPNDAETMRAESANALFGTQDRPDLFQLFTRVSPPGQPGILWMVLRTEPLERILAPVRSTQRLMIALAVLALVATIALASLIARGIVRPVRQLAGAAADISAGNWDAPLPVVRSGDEIQALAGAFASMMEDLKANYEHLEGQAEELRLANALAIEGSRLKSEFLATMSHELRTPLNAMIGFTGILLEGMRGEIDEDARHLIERVEANANRLLTLINDVLDIARIEAGRMALVPAPLSVRVMARSWQNQMGVLAQEKGLAFNLEVDPELPDDIYGDHDRITQIAVNLLSNAFKFTETGGVTLSLKQDGESWHIQVSDTGIGIPPHALNYIFEEFRQADGSPRRAYGGTGLGLAIVRNLCRMMGGSVHVSSKLDQGSVFTVTLPLRAVSQPQLA